MCCGSTSNCAIGMGRLKLDRTAVAPRRLYLGLRPDLRYGSWSTGFHLGNKIKYRSQFKALPAFRRPVLAAEGAAL